jgi:hypothetical protein
MKELVLKVGDGIEIREVEPGESYLAGRLLSYSERFSAENLKYLTHFDSESFHFGIFLNNNLVGGFRATPLGKGRSEVEELFSEIKFPENSFEMGRLWISSNLKDQRIGIKSMRVLLDHMRHNLKADVYAKTGAVLAPKFMAAGLVDLKMSAWHPILKYTTGLYCFKAQP